MPPRTLRAQWALNVGVPFASALALAACASGAAPVGTVTGGAPVVVSPTASAAESTPTAEPSPARVRPTAVVFPPSRPSRLTGTILDTAASARVFTLQTAGTAITVAVDDATAFRFADGGPAGFAELRPGANVDVTGRPGPAGFLAEEVVIGGGR